MIDVDPFIMFVVKSCKSAFLVCSVVLLNILMFAVLGKMWGTWNQRLSADFPTDLSIGNPANPELIQIPAGQLYLVRPNSIKGSRECIFKDAVATIRRTGVDFQYQLVVTRAYEEGEEQLLDEDAESEL